MAIRRTINIKFIFVFPDEVLNGIFVMHYLTGLDKDGPSYMVMRATPAAHITLNFFHISFLIKLIQGKVFIKPPCIVLRL